MMYYLYVLRSIKSNKYYLGITSHPLLRLEEHNTSERQLYTSTDRPWEKVGLYNCGEDLGEALKIERYIKKQKSRRFIENILSGSIEFYGILTKLQKVEIK